MLNQGSPIKLSTNTNRKKEPADQSTKVIGSNKESRNISGNAHQPDAEFKSRDALEEDSGDKDLTEVMANASQADEEDNFDGID